MDLVRRRLHVAESASEVGGRQARTTTKNHQPRSVPVRLGNWRTRVFDPSCVAAVIIGRTSHDLRHTAASLAIAAGAPVKAVQRTLGHSSAAMTLHIYAGRFGAA